MFTGELEFGELPFEPRDPEPRYLLLLVFVFFIVVVMMNLLNGLAVSDITRLRGDAEIWAARSDAEIIHSLVISTGNIIYIQNIYIGSGYWSNKRCSISVLDLYPIVGSDGTWDFGVGFGITKTVERSYPPKI